MQGLLPTIPKNSVIVLDSATCHKRKDMFLAVKEREHTLEFLQPYSPDLNPIEKKWAQAKSMRRKFGHTPENFLFAESYDVLF